jgi:hypothetical protein
VPVALFPSSGSFPCVLARSASTSSFSRPARRLLTLQPTHSRSRLTTHSIEGFGRVVAFPPAPIATGWSDPCREGLAPSQELCLSTAHEDDALSIANDTLYGLGAGVWTRNGNRAYRFGRAIQAGRVWTNCYHAYPAHAAFGGYKQSGIGRENHKMMLDHYQNTKNVLVSYGTKALGFF